MTQQLLGLISTGVRGAFTKLKRRPRVAKSFCLGCPTYHGKRKTKCKGCGPSNCPFVGPNQKFDPGLAEYYKTHPGELGWWYEKRKYL